MRNTIILLLSLTTLPVRSQSVSGLVNQVINVTVPLDLAELVTDGSESLLCRASVPFIKFIEDQTEKDSLLGILFYLIL